MPTPAPKRRFKWEPPVLMVLVLALGAWLVWERKHAFTGIDPAPGTRTVELRVGNSRGIVEVTPADAPATSFRVMLRNGYVSPPLSPEQFAQQFGEQALDDVTLPRANVLFRLFNITNWGGVAWAALGLLGQGIFSARFLVQWLASEKERKTVIPVAFWYLSLAGGVILFTYFVWRQDFVGVLGQSSGLVIYARNIKLAAKHRKAMSEAAAKPENAQS
jgi:lipid-A-disaccharide synthase-like uncharacterized protein